MEGQEVQQNTVQQTTVQQDANNTSVSKQETQVKESVKQEPVKQEPTPFKFDPKSTTPALDLAMHYLEQNGIKKTHPLYQNALESGDFRAIEGFLLGKGCKDAAPYLNIIKAEFQNYQKEVKKQESEIDAAIQSVIPTEEVQDVVAWIKQNATEDELKEIMRIGETKQGAFMMAKLLYPMYKEAISSGAYSSRTAQQVTDSNKTPAWASLPTSSANDAPMTQAEYINELRALEKKMGRHSVGNSAEYKRLQARFAKSFK